ncbi:hypothetical protein BC830DRAFT_544283 [Chytriomyces sp. MP71]|nr:hypothetical protein BC830DRAFT_544283 [Chytriomyces sp. MP71]
MHNAIATKCLCLLLRCKEKQSPGIRWRSTCRKKTFRCHCILGGLLLLCLKKIQPAHRLVCPRLRGPIRRMATQIDTREKLDADVDTSCDLRTTAWLNLGTSKRHFRPVNKGIDVNGSATPPISLKSLQVGREEDHYKRPISCHSSPKERKGKERLSEYEGKEAENHGSCLSCESRFQF